MSFIPNQAANTGSFVPTTNIWDVGEIYNVEGLSPEMRELLVRLYQNLNNMSVALNNKISGYYVQQEFNTSGLYFNPNSTDPNKLRSEFAITIDTGALGAGATTVAHGLTIDSNWKLTQIYGAATKTTGTYYPLPYVDSAGVLNISLSMNATNILITNSSGITFNSSIVVIKYVKN
jgi:hypothetical protein